MVNTEVGRNTRNFAFPSSKIFKSNKNKMTNFDVRRLTKNDADIVAALVKLERLFKKSESWGEALADELRRRNAVTLYAVASHAVQQQTPNLYREQPNGGAPRNAKTGDIPATKDQLFHEEVAGYVLLMTTGLVAHVSKIVVVPAWRRQGVGRSLMQAAIGVASKERSVGSMTLHVAETNEAAIGLYTQLNFQPDGVLQDYYGPGRQAAKLRLEFGYD